MRKMFILAVVGLLVLLQAIIFADESSPTTLGHQHAEGEECMCEVAEQRDITVQETEILSKADTEERLANVEETISMLYELINSKASVEDFNAMSQTLEERIIKLEEGLLNLDSTISTGLPSIRDMVYELSKSLSLLEDRLTEYVHTTIDESLETFTSDINEIKNQVESLRVAVDIQDSDILKLYETTSNLSDRVSNLENLSSTIDALSQLLETLSLHSDMYNQDIVNIYDALSSKANISDVERISLEIEAIQAEVSNLKNTEFADLNKQLSQIVAKIDTHNIDILTLYTSVEQLFKQIQMLSGRISTLETMVRDLNQKIGK